MARQRNVSEIVLFCCDYVIISLGYFTTASSISTAVKPCFISYMFTSFHMCLLGEKGRSDSTLFVWKKGGRGDTSHFHDLTYASSFCRSHAHAQKLCSYSSQHKFLKRLNAKQVEVKQRFKLHRASFAKNAHSSELSKEDDISMATLIWRAIKLPMYSVALIPLTVSFFYTPKINFSMLHR